jgi:hypothetical protein
MKISGFIDGIGWSSTALHGRLIHEAVRDRVGRLRMAPMIASPREFPMLVAQVTASRWIDAGTAPADAAQVRERSNAKTLRPRVEDFARPLPKRIDGHAPAALRAAWETNPKAARTARPDSTPAPSRAKPRLR